MEDSKHQELVERAYEAVLSACELVTHLSRADTRLSRVCLATALLNKLKPALFDLTILERKKR